jgi:hypothetical protein
MSKPAVTLGASAIPVGLSPDEAPPHYDAKTRALSCIAFVILFTAAIWACLLYAAGAFLHAFGAPS